MPSNTLLLVIIAPQPNDHLNNHQPVQWANNLNNGVIRMISFKQLGRLIITIGFSALVLITSSLSLGVKDSWAITSFQHPIIQLATMSPAEIMGKNKNANSEAAQAENAEEAKRFKAETLEGMNNSIVNPDYRPGGKPEKQEKEDKQDIKDIKAEANEAMDSFETN